MAETEATVVIDFQISYLKRTRLAQGYNFEKMDRKAHIRKNYRPFVQFHIHIRVSRRIY